MYIFNKSKVFFKMNKTFYVSVLVSFLMVMVSCSPVEPENREPLTEMAKILSSDGTNGDLFGRSVAVDGDYAIAGALYDDDNGPNSGSAYIFVRSGTTWIQQEKLTASDGAENDHFGLSVAIKGDYAIVGGRGGVYVFFRSGDNWTEQAKLVGSGNFGFPVATDGDYAVVGTFNRSDVAFIYARSGTTWSLQKTLVASDDRGQLLDFGSSVAISGDTVVVGASDEVDPATSIYGRGSVYVFAREGNNWTEQAKLIASDGVAEDIFGYSVAIDGDTVIVGAHQEHDPGFSLYYRGSAYVFTREGTNWTEQAKLIASDAAGGDVFGWSVAIAGDMAIVGAPWDDGTFTDTDSQSGSAYIFTRSGGNWTEQAKLIASDSAYRDYFGRSVSIGGGYIAVSGHANDDNGEDSGSAYIFQMP